MGLWVPFSFKPLQGWGRLGLIVPGWFSERLCPKTVKGTQVLWPLYAAHINCNFFFTLFTCLCVTGTSMPWYLCGAMGVGLFFIACGFQESNAGHQVWYQVPSFAEPSCKLTKKEGGDCPGFTIISKSVTLNSHSQMLGLQGCTATSSLWSWDQTQCFVFAR